MGGATLYAKLIERLIEEPGSFAQLADYTGLHASTVRRYIRALRDLKTPRVCIADWEEDRHGTRSVPVYAFAPAGGKDAPRPRMTQAEKARRYRERKKLRVNSVFAQETHVKLKSLSRPLA